MKKYIFIIISIFTTYMVNAQGDFKVICQKGKNTIDGKEFNIGIKLSSKSNLIIVKNGFVGLLHKSGKTIEIKKDGKYSVADLESKFANTNISTSKKYTDFVINELTKQDKDINENYKKYMNSTASVERGKKEKIELFLPKSSSSKPNIIFLKTYFDLNWTPVINANQYTVQIFNLNDEEIYSKETADTNLTIDLSNINTDFSKVLFLKVSPKGETNPKNIEQRKIQFSINNAFQSELSLLNEETGLNYYLKAKFFQENNIFEDAIFNYKKAITLSPDITEYKEAYNQYLFSVGLIEFL